MNWNIFWAVLYLMVGTGIAIHLWRDGHKISALWVFIVTLDKSLREATK